MSAAACKADRFRFLDDIKRHRIVSAAQFLQLRQILIFDTGAGCWASTERLADEIGSSKPSVCRNLAQLHQAGFYWTEQPKKGRGTRAYRHINWTALEAALRIKKDAESGTLPDPEKVSFPANKGLTSGKRKVSFSIPEVKELEVQKKPTHRAHARPEPTDSARADEPRVCVFSETEAGKANGESPKAKPEPPKPKSAQQEDDVPRRQENGPPGSDAPAADVGAKFAIVAGAYGVQGGHLGKARGIFTTVAAEYEQILTHINATAKGREKTKPESRKWLWSYLEDAPWRYETVAPQKPPPAPEPEFCGPPLPEHIQKARSDAAREACLAALGRGQTPIDVYAAEPDPEPPPEPIEPPPSPEPEPPPPVVAERVIIVQEHELERVEPRAPSGMTRSMLALEALRRGTAAPPPPPEATDDWQRKAAEVRAQDVGALGDLVRGLAASKTEAMQVKPYAKREPLAAAPRKRDPAPQVSESIEDKIRSAMRLGVEEGALLEIVRKVDREGRSDGELRELVARVIGEEVTA